MANNINNWGLNFYTSKSNPTSKNFSMINIAGCNQAVRRSEDIGNIIISAVPVEFWKEWGMEQSTYCEFLTNNGFPCRPATKEEIEKIGRSVTNNTIKDWEGDTVKFDVKNFVYFAQDLNYNTIVNKTYYYVFCVIRHLYYHNYNWRTEVVISSLKDGNFLERAAKLSTKDSAHSLFHGEGVPNPQLINMLSLGVGNQNFLMTAPFIKPNTEYYLDAKEQSGFIVSTGSKNYYLHEKTEANRKDKFVLLNSGVLVNIATVLDNKTKQRVGAILLNDIPLKQYAIKEEKITVYSRHPSHDCFRNMKFNDTKVLLALGSMTVPKKKYDVIINNVDAIQRSANKFLMKRAFTKADVKTPEWYSSMDGEARTVINEQTKVEIPFEELPFPIVAKHVLGSKNRGNTKIDNVQELERWIVARKNRLENFIFEKFYRYAKEYRVHVTNDGAFLVWRKLQRRDTPDDQRWFFNSTNCEWSGDGAPSFDQPISYKEMLAECVKALKAVGLTIGGVDIRVEKNTYKPTGSETEKKRSETKFVVIEINSACSMAERTEEAYKEQINKIVAKFKK